MGKKAFYLGKMHTRYRQVPAPFLGNELIEGYFDKSTNPEPVGKPGGGHGGQGMIGAGNKIAKSHGSIMPHK
jgi:hypothetical protein